jgi:aryl-alcohol dehydrogenase-like predicted oxidoreductase
MSLTGRYGPWPSEQEGIALLHAALDAGVTYFDTAEVYGLTANETIVGKALAGLHDRVTIGTKFGFDLDEAEATGRAGGVDSHPTRIRRVADASLKRLGAETIDLFYQHRVDPNVPIEDVAGTVRDLIVEGKIRYFGLSEAGAGTIRRAHAVQPVSAVESEYSLWTRDPEIEVLPTCRELGIGFVPYSPLGRGFLAGSVTRHSELAAGDFRKLMPRFSDDAMRANTPLVEALGRLANSRGCTVAQLALAWLLHRGDDIVPIPGTTKIARVRENVTAAAISLDQYAIEMIDAALPPSEVEGSRYDSKGMEMVNL